MNDRSVTSNVVADMSELKRLAAHYGGYAEKIMRQAATEIEQRRAGETSEKPAPYSRTTDAAMWAFQQRFGHVPMSTGDQQWVNGYARALQHMRTDSVPTESPVKSKGEPRPYEPATTQDAETATESTETVRLRIEKREPLT